jgi:DNA-binding protein YbaB
MQNDKGLGDIAGLMDSLRTQMGAIADIEQRAAQLTATAAVHDERIVVTVNADGHLIDIHFSEKVNSLSYSEISAGTLAAVQAAAADVRQQAEELIAPLRQSRAQVPALHEMIAGLPDLQAEMPVPPPVLTEVPDPVDEEPVERPAGPASLIAPDDDEVVGDLTFADVEEHDPSGLGDSASKVADAGWD